MDIANTSLFNYKVEICNNNANFLNTTVKAQRYIPQYYTLPEQILVFVTGALLSIITILGNALVCFGYYSNRRLQTITNLFICSLAVTDMSVGLFSIPFYTTYISLRSWPLGEVVWDIWLCLDYVLTQTSIIHLVIISADRYFSIKFPIKYRSERTKYRTKVVISMAWIISFLQWFPFVVIYPFINGKATVNVESRYKQFSDEYRYANIVLASSYFISVLVIATNLFTYLHTNISKRKTL